MEQLTDKTRAQERAKIEQEILARFTAEEQAEYKNLQEYYNELAGEHFLASVAHYSDEKKTGFSKVKEYEALEELRKRYENASKAYFSNKVYIAFSLEYARRYPVKADPLPDLYIDALHPSGEEPLTEEENAKIEEYRALESFLRIEIAAHKEKYNGRSLEDLIKTEYCDEHGQERPDGLFMQAVEAAKKIKEEQSQTEIIQITEKGVKAVEYPLDKINKTIWDNLTYERDGQLRFGFEREVYKFEFDTVKKKQEFEPLVICTIDFSKLEKEGVTGITKKLTAFDKRVYIAVNGLYAAGYDYITINQIYAVMTNKKTNPNAKDREKINNALYKMQGRVYISNQTENKQYNYDYFKYEGALLPYDRTIVKINGKMADVIRIYRPAGEKETDPRALPLVQFAKKRGQYTTITTEVFGALSLTEHNLEIEDYLIEQIGHIKRRSINNKMLYSTILDATGQKSRNQVMRGREKIHDLLAHFKKTGFICDYTEGKDSITIILEDAPKITAKKK